MTRVVYLEGILPPPHLFFSLFFPSSLRRVSAIRTVFLIQTELVSSLYFQVAASRKGKSELDQEIEIVSSFLLGWRFVTGSGLRK